MVLEWKKKQKKQNMIHVEEKTAYLLALHNIKMMLMASQQNRWTDHTLWLRIYTVVPEHAATRSPEKQNERWVIPPSKVPITVPVASLPAKKSSRY